VNWAFVLWASLQFRAEPHITLPEYDPKARTFDSALFVERMVSETCPINPSPETLVGTFTQEWEERDPMDSYTTTAMKATIPPVKGTRHAQL